MPEIAETVPAKKNGRHPGGRPSYRTPELADQICTLIASGKLISEVVENIGRCDQFIYDWEDADLEFAGKLARARVRWADAFADLTTRLLAEEPRMTGEGDFARVDSGWVQHITSRANWNKWLLGCRDSARYGDKAQSITVGVGVSVAPQIVLQMPEELLAVRPLEDKGSGRTLDQKEPP
jgi:hypothetical protein